VPSPTKTNPPKIGWWYTKTPLKNDGVKVKWDDEIPNIWKVRKIMFQTTNQ